MCSSLANMGALINIISCDEHVPKVERLNRTTKDMVKSQYNMLRFTHIPPIFIIEMVYAQVFCLNMFALKGSISKTLSPSEIILNCKLDLNAHCKVQYREYVETHEEHDNSMSTRTVGAIATCPTGNLQGGYYFIQRDSGSSINCQDWTTITMPQEVVDQVHQLA